jgi:hypothetical protein
MTIALCLNCGDTKFGAICPCPGCNVASTGNMQLDITFSDHHMSVDTLKAFGGVVKAIKQVCDDDQLRFWSFIRYVSLHHPDILGVKLPPQEEINCDVVLARANAPAVEIEESPRARLEGELKSPDAHNGESHAG